MAEDKIIRLELSVGKLENTTPLFIPCTRLSAIPRDILTKQCVSSRAFLGRSTRQGFEVFIADKMPHNTAELEQLLGDFQTWKNCISQLGHKRWLASTWILAYLVGITLGTIA